MADNSGAFNWDRVRVTSRPTERKPVASHSQPARDAPAAAGMSLRRQGGAPQHSMYRTPEADRTMGRTQGALDKTQILVDGRVQDLCAESGVKRTTPGNIADAGPHINANILRFTKNSTFTGKLTHDGGWNYAPTVCSGNWAEDREEPTFASGFHARELGFSKLYQTESSERYAPPSSEYYNTILSEHRVAKFPAPSKGVRNGNHSDGHYVYYANRGFGTKAHMDHTAPAKRGAYWVGIAPPTKHQTIAMTTAQQEPLEFQQRNSVFDAKAKLLGAHPQDNPDGSVMQHTLRGLQQSQRFTSTWQTSYNAEFKDRSRRANGASTGPLRSQTAHTSWAGPSAALLEATVRPTTALA